MVQDALKAQRHAKKIKMLAVSLSNHVGQLTSLVKDYISYTSGGYSELDSPIFPAHIANHITGFDSPCRVSHDLKYVCVCFFYSDECDYKPLTRVFQGLKGKRKLYEAPKPQYYYHLEYKLFPNDPDPVKADVVTYGIAAKIYSESDSKVLKTWEDGERTWVTWTHRLVKCIIAGKSTSPMDGHSF